MSRTLPAPRLADMVGELSVMLCQQEGASRCRVQAEALWKSAEVGSREVLEWVTEGTWPLVNQRAGPGQPEAPFCPCSWNGRSLPTLPALGAVSGTSLGE